jgi:hypothetical protein
VCPPGDCGADHRALGQQIVLAIGPTAIRHSVRGSHCNVLLVDHFQAAGSDLML